MGNSGNQKDKLIKLIKDLGESIDSDTVKKINFKQFERVSKRLIQFFDECKECQEYADTIIKYGEDTKNFSDLQNKKELLNYHRTLKTIVSHLENKHKLIVEGHFMSIYISIGLAIGAGLGVTFNNVGIGISIGLCIGVAIGVGLDADYRKRGMVI